MRTDVIAAVALALAFLGLSAGSARAQVGGPMGAPREERRADIVRQAEEAGARFAEDSADATARLDYARLLLESGSFEQAREVLAPLLYAPEPTLDAVLMGARLAYYVGDYGAAERLFTDVIERDPGNARGTTGLLLTHYQTNAFARASALPEETRASTKFPMLDLMLAFGDDVPYRARWTGPREVSIPFIALDPLPVIEVTVGGLTINAIIDTGTDLFILDSDIAESLGITPVTTMTGTFAGGKQAEIGSGRVDSLAIGGVTLRSVPVSLLPTKHLGLGEREIGGIVGTAVLRQFLSTLDYPNARLVLRERVPGAGDAFLAASGGRVADVVPFYLQGTHFILAHGSLNGHGGLLFHVDTGLAGVPSFAAPRETLESLGIPIPEVAVKEGVIGGGGGGFAVGEFDIAELGLGRLTRTNLVGSYGGQPPGSYWALGFIMDGLISHNFLRDYAWTFDFDGMRMVATQ